MKTEITAMKTGNQGLKREITAMYTRLTRVEDDFVKSKRNFMLAKEALATREAVHQVENACLDLPWEGCPKYPQHW